MSEYREKAEEIAASISEVDRHGEIRVNISILESRLATFAMERERKAFKEAEDKAQALANAYGLRAASLKVRH